eukprot:Clim_evm30s225 gene=Clim_evmTU30s225
MALGITKDNAPSWWATVCIVGLGIFGIFTILSFSPSCWFGGIYIFCMAIVIATLEGPAFCTNYSTILQYTREKSQPLQSWMRTILYYFLAVWCFYPCTGFFTILAGISILVLGTLHLFKAIGDRGSGYSHQTDDPEAQFM